MDSLSKENKRLLKSLSTPRKVQDFIDTLSINFEEEGETLMSPKMVLKTRKAHCIEGAILAALAFWMNGKKPLILDLKASSIDEDHVVALYRVGNFWGAVSKSNHATLRFRDPVYKTLRELTLSYFHEYFENKGRIKTLRSYSLPFDLRKFGDDWVGSEEDLWEIAIALDDSTHYPLLPKSASRILRKADDMELKAGVITEWLSKSKNI